MGTDNFVEDVHGGFQCEVQKPYVLYRNRANEVSWVLHRWTTVDTWPPGLMWYGTEW